MGREGGDQKAAVVIVVPLTWGEVYRAGEAALQREISNLKKKRKDAHGADVGALGGLQIHFVGCLGETAVAKHYNLYWRATDFGAVDVGERFEVRAAYNGEHKRLPLYDRDSSDLPFILAHVIPAKLPNVMLAGWVYGWEGKQREYFGEANPNKPTGRTAYWVPNSLLHAMEDLRI